MEEKKNKHEMWVVSVLGKILLCYKYLQKVALKNRITIPAPGVNCSISLSVIGRVLALNKIIYSQVLKHSIKIAFQIINQSNIFHYFCENEHR